MVKTGHGTESVTENDGSSLNLSVFFHFLICIINLMNDTLSFIYKRDIALMVLGSKYCLGNSLSCNKRETVLVNSIFRGGYNNIHLDLLRKNNFLIYTITLPYPKLLHLHTKLKKASGYGYNYLGS